MTAATIVWRMEAGLPMGIEIAVITCAADADTFASKLGKVKGAIFQPNRDNAATDSWGTTISGQTVTIQLIGTTAVTGTLFVVGMP